MAFKDSISALNWF